MKRIFNISYNDLVKLIIVLVLFACAVSTLISCQKEEQPQSAQPHQQTQQQISDPVTGTMSFYIDINAVPEDKFYYGFRLYINNEPFAQWNIHTTTEPNCASWYCVNYFDTAGTYTFRAEKLSNPLQAWDSTFTITKEGCTKIALRNQ